VNKTYVTWFFLCLNLTLSCDPHWNRLSRDANYTIGFDWERELSVWYSHFLNVIIFISQPAYSVTLTGIVSPETILVSGHTIGSDWENAVWYSHFFLIFHPNLQRDPHWNRLFWDDSTIGHTIGFNWENNSKPFHTLNFGSHLSYFSTKPIVVTSLESSLFLYDSSEWSHERCDWETRESAVLDLIYSLDITMSAPDKVRKINLNWLFLHVCYFFTKSYVCPRFGIVSLRRF